MIREREGKIMANQQPKNNKAAVDYGELVDFLGEKFDKIDKNFDKIDEKFDKIDERFDKIDEKFEKIDSQLATKADKTDIDRVLTRIGGIGDKVNDYRAEQLTIKTQVDRHERWHRQAAQKIGIKLED